MGLIDLSKLSFKELWQLYYQVGCEIFKREWWIISLLLLIALFIFIISKVKRKHNYLKFYLFCFFEFIKLHRSLFSFSIIDGKYKDNAFSYAHSCVYHEKEYRKNRIC